jgi:hypothetical protein
MAKKKHAPKKATIQRRAPAAAAFGGPVTLDEAKALAAPPRPARALRRSAAIAAATPGTVGLERRRRAIAVREENRRRTAEYAATLRLMKKRGVADPKQPRRARALAAPKVVQPLQVFAEGDSWFDYPVPLFGGGIITRLEKLLGVPILNLAKAGDEVRFMLGVEERKLIVKQFTNGCPAGGPWDAMMFSGGGNDIVDNPMALWVKDFDPNIPIEDHLHAQRFDTALALVRAGYEDLIALRDTLSPATTLIFHAYDFAIPDGRGICHLGPWLKPTFDLRRFPDQAGRVRVVKEMLVRFATMLSQLAVAHKDVLFVNAQGTLSPVSSSWHNELHPAKKGFQQFAERFQKELKQLFPQKVL